jgi:hypothetical protein
MVLMPEPAVSPAMSKRVLALIVLIAALLLGAVAVVVIRALPESAQSATCTALHRARIATVLLADDADLRCEGVSTLPAEQAAKGKNPLGQKNASELVALLKAHKASAIAVVPNPKAQDGTVRGQLARLEYVEGLRGLVLSPRLAVYAPAGNLEFSEKERTALVYVARALLRGAREPSLSSFPPSLRRVENVEVMVALAPPGGARLLWRSTRGTSIPRALMAATRVARDRWHEREATMGGPLREKLNTLQVEVTLLVEDGTIESPEATFIDRAVTKVHGIGFDYRSDWHYLMPEDVQKRGSGSPYRALLELGKDYAVSATALAREETRIYRFVPVPVGVSPPSPNTAQIRLHK